MGKKLKGKAVEESRRNFKTKLKINDPVIVISGGNSLKSKKLVGEIGKIKRILPKSQRVVVEGVNIVKRHKKALRPGESSGIISKEGSVAISNVMYYNDEIKKPLRLKYKVMDDGRKVRGFINPETKEFEQIADK